MFWVKLHDSIWCAIGDIITYQWPRSSTCWRMITNNNVISLQMLAGRRSLVLPKHWSNSYFAVKMFKNYKFVLLKLVVVFTLKFLLTEAPDLIPVRLLEEQLRRPFPNTLQLQIVLKLTVAPSKQTKQMTTKKRDFQTLYITVSLQKTTTARYGSENNVSDVLLF